MKVRVSITVEVDEAAWAREYGVAVGIPDDVKSYIGSTVQDIYPTEVGIITDVHWS